MSATTALRQRHPAARWTRAEQLHMTMVFIGATPVEEVGRIEHAVAQVAARWTPFEVTTGEGGGFTNRRSGGVAWLRVAEGYRHVARLSLDLDEAMASASYAEMDPRPHLTLARGVTNELLEDLRATANELQLRWRVDNVALFRSHSGQQSRYEVLARHPLAGPRG
jgi:RNA 2',3'-cyclic 3'-phosphodiesterase